MWSHLKTLTPGCPGSILCVSILPVLRNQQGNVIPQILPPCDPKSKPICTGHSRPRTPIPSGRTESRVLPRDQLLSCCFLRPCLEQFQLCHFLRAVPALSKKCFLLYWAPENHQGVAIKEALGRNPVLMEFKFLNSVTLGCGYGGTAGAVLLSVHCLRGTVASKHPVFP